MHIASGNTGSQKQSLVRYDPVKSYLLFLLVPSFLFLSRCISDFYPVVAEEKELLVVEAFITDQPGTDTVKLSKSIPLGRINEAKPLSDCFVTINDDLGNIHLLTEQKAGTYITDSATFRGMIGRIYSLHIRTSNGINYESNPTEMKAVPPIDSIYYEKTVIKEGVGIFFRIDGCQIYLDTHDSSNNCKYYRWDYSETWVLRLPFFVVNQICWITEKSRPINIKSTAAFDEAKIIKHPINFIDNVTDRLKRKYSILVNQYSISEEEYNYWQELQNIREPSGGLYDVIPASVPSNMTCIENPEEKVLGYFSVSAKTSKRFFIQGDFKGIIERYDNCVTGTIFGSLPEGLGVSYWILEDHLDHTVPFWIVTDKKGCADCTVRGSNKRPSYWED
jgi:hypothetical protein